MRPFIRLVLAFLFVASHAAAQSIAFTSVEGRVLDTRGRAVPNADVRLGDTMTGGTRWVTTARDGTFKFDGVPEGRYDVSAEAIGFQPVVWSEAALRAGVATRITLTLRPVAPPVVAADALAAEVAGEPLGAWLVDRGYGDLAGARRNATEIAEWAPRGDMFGIEGLPWRHAHAVVDGVRTPLVAGPGSPGADALVAPTMRALARGGVGGLGSDVEYGGSGLGLRATTRRGTGGTGVQALVESGAANDGAWLAVGGPLQGDAASGIAAVDVQRSTRPSWRAIAADREDERVSAFGRLDWNADDRVFVTATASGTRTTTRGSTDAEGVASWIAPRLEQTSMLASVNLLARLGAQAWQEWRLSTTLSDAISTRDSIGRVYAGTFERQLATGFDESRSSPSLTGIVHADVGAHRLKVGFTATSHRVSTGFTRDADGAYRLDAVAALSVSGAWRRVDAPVAPGDFSVSETAFYIQDTWQMGPGFSATFGLRADAFKLPVSRLERNVAWQNATGLDNSDVRGTRSRMAPRLAVRWELGPSRAWVIDGEASVFNDLPDFRELGEAITLDRGAGVRYGIGALPSPGTPPSALEAPVVGRTLTQLAPDFDGLRTQRVAASISRAIGEWRVSLQAVERVTDGLARRVELNRPVASLGSDQHGRPLYGALQQVGDVLAAQAGSNRRFAGFESVQGIETSGRSTYRGATVGVERERSEGFSLSAFYTYSTTEDDVATLSAMSLSPFPDGLSSGDWMSARSDLDVPHRALLSVGWRSSRSPVSVGAVYRVRSGLPFTPGLSGVADANSDGDWSNDPAFVDAALPGMDAVLDANSCLRAGRFAARNSCREPMAQGLDLRVRVQLPRLAIGRPELLIDAIDVLATNAAPFDRALLLVDRAAGITTDPGTGATVIPYIVNSNFGEALDGRQRGVLWRVGLRVTP